MEAWPSSEAKGMATSTVEEIAQWRRLLKKALSLFPVSDFHERGDLQRRHCRLLRLRGFRVNCISVRFG